MITDRIIQRNMPLRDGTPRHEKGYRAIVETIGPDLCKAIGWLSGKPQKRYFTSPLFEREADALAWVPDHEAAK